MPMPIFLQPRMLLTAAAALALSACFGTPDAMKGGGTKRSGGATAQRPQTTGAPSFTSAAARQCAVDLRQAGVKFTPLPNEDHGRSEEHTSELQSLMRTSYAVFCLKKKKKTTQESGETTAYIR